MAVAAATTAPVSAVSAAEYGALRADLGQSMEGLPAFSPNALALIQAARDEAAARGHPGVGTEHLLWALLQPSCAARMKGWLHTMMPAGTDWQADLLARLDANPVWAHCHSAGATSAAAAAAAAPPFTPAVMEIFGVVRDFANHPVCDGGVTIVDGLVASEFVIAAVLLHGINVASELLGRASVGRVNSWTIFEAIGVDPRTVHVRRSVTAELVAFSEGGGAAPGAPFELGAPLPDPEALPAPPTRTSNWLVPGHVRMLAPPS